MAKYHVLPEFLLSWKTNYLSWKNFLNDNPELGIIVKFEDLVNNSKKTFSKIITFIQKKQKIKFDIDKFDNCLKSINFNNLKKIELTFGFDEKSSSGNNFFRKGLVDEWKKELPEEIIDEIERKYYDEMKEIGYL